MQTLRRYVSLGNTSWSSEILTCSMSELPFSAMAFRVYAEIAKMATPVKFFLLCFVLFCFVLFLQSNLIILYLNLGVLGRLSVCFHGGVAGIFCCCYCLVGWYGLGFFCFLLCRQTLQNSSLALHMCKHWDCTFSLQKDRIFVSMADEECFVFCFEF